MPTPLETLLALEAERLAPTFASAVSVVLCAAQEYHVREVAAATVRQMGVDLLRLDLVDAATDTSWTQQVSPGSVLLLDASCSGEVLLAHASVVIAVAAALPVSLVVVTLESDVVPPYEVYNVFHVVLGPASLSVRDGDLQLMGGQWGDVELRHEVLRVTGGSPALVQAVVEELEGHPQEARSLSVEVAHQTQRSRQGTECGPLVRAAATWAGRLLPLMEDRPLVLLHAFLPALSASQLAAVATRVEEREVSVEEVMEARLFPGVLRHEDERDTFAPAVAAQIVRLTAETHPGQDVGLRRALAQAVLEEVRYLSPVERITALVGIGAWPSLNDCLRRDLPAVALLPRAHRLALRELLPTEVLSTWVNLHRCHQFLSHDETGVHVLPTPWNDLLRLLSMAEEDDLSERMLEVRDRLTKAASVSHAPRVESATEAIECGCQWLRLWAADLSQEVRCTDGVPARAVEEMPVLALILLGAADSALARGWVVVSRRCLNEASQLMEMIGTDTQSVPVLRLGLAARHCLLSALSGVRARTKASLAEYEGLVQRTGLREEEPERIVLIARRFLDVSLASSPRSTSEIVANTAFTPLEVQAEALIILVQRGPTAATDWIQTFLARAPWTDLDSASWWPLHTCAAFIALREGEGSAAVEIVSAHYVPLTTQHLVRAGAAVLEGDTQSAERLINQVLRDPVVPDRWRRLAFGIRVTILARRNDPGLASEVEAHLADWTESPSVVALLPEEGRRAILPGLSPELAQAPGMRVDGAGLGSGLALTPRQQDVLRGLAADMSVSEIAEELVLGTETVRSTAKTLYRRLGVHNREAAVRLAHTYFPPKRRDRQRSSPQ